MERRRNTLRMRTNKSDCIIIAIAFIDTCLVRMCTLTVGRLNLSFSQRLICFSCLLFFFIIIILNFLHRYHIHKYVRDERRASLMLALANIFPICAAAAVFGIFVPTTTNVMNVIIPCYLTKALQAFIELITSLYGGQKRMAERLEEAHATLRCGFHCFWNLEFGPGLEPSRRNLRIMAILVYVPALIDIGFALIVYIMSSEGVHEMDHITAVLKYFKICLAMIGCLACHSYAHVTHKVIKAKFRIPQIFRMVQALLLSILVQEAVFSLLARYGVVSKDYIGSAEIHALVLWDQILIYELFIVSLVSTWYFRPTNCALFDKCVRDKHGLLRRSHNAASLEIQVVMPKPRSKTRISTASISSIADSVKVFRSRSTDDNQESSPYIPAKITNGSNNNRSGVAAKISKKGGAAPKQPAQFALQEHDL